MTLVTFKVPGTPQGKGRPRAVKIAGKARMATAKETVAYEGLIALAAQQAMAGRPPLSGPVVLRVHAAFPVPPSWSKRKQSDALAGKIRPTGKPDLDNIVKAIGDGCNGVAWVDDSAITELVTSKVYGLTPGVTVGFWPLGEVSA